MPHLSTRIDTLPAYVFAVIGDRIRKMQTDGLDVIRLDIGNPDMPPPPQVIEALGVSASKADNHGYSGYRGTRSFREAVAEHYKSRFGVDVDPDDEVLPLLGSKEAIINLCLTYLDENSAALIPDIGYPSYAMGTRMANSEIIWMPLTNENNFTQDIADMPPDALDRARIAWVNYPNNPTGRTVRTDFYQKIADHCRKHDILLVSDNPYMDIVYDDYVAPSALEAGTKNVIELFSFSKSYNMAGWRLGAAVGDADAISSLLRTKSNIDSGHFKAVYDAGIEALRTPQQWIDERNLIYQRRRDIILDALPQLGLKAEKPFGSLYVWAEVLNESPQTYIEKALEQTHVSLAPGEAYGPGGAKYVRISLGVSDQRLEEALGRLITWNKGR